ncbi:hypothetical protein [Paenibacillus tyrfis]|uniref:Uncharacterized protein n=1 Tax=Paenibacillus tyrfis TaxID=1501230 RepID=A0A081P4G9_9BACL|nr:hypothetical protein [Paenibacillus tyrfis]KEQ25592.1 hypothetical protein ET33_02420 [Paenibacillus tyrfis]
MNIEEAQVKEDERIKKREAAWAEEIAKENESRNFAGTLVNFIGWATVILSVIFGLWVSMEQNGTLGFVYIISGTVTGILLVGFSEVINLLQKIYNNSRK